MNKLKVSIILFLASLVTATVSSARDGESCPFEATQEMFQKALKAIEEDRVDDFNSYVRDNPDLARFRESQLLWEAAKANNTNIAEILLGYGASPNDFMPNRSTPLLEAVKNRNTVIVRMLLNQNADSSANKFEALKEAMMTDQPAIIELLSRDFKECVKSGKCKENLWDNK